MKIISIWVNEKTNQKASWEYFEKETVRFCPPNDCGYSTRMIYIDCTALISFIIYRLLKNVKQVMLWGIFRSINKVLARMTTAKKHD